MTTIATDRPQFDIRQGMRGLVRAVTQVSVSALTLAVTATGFTRADGGSFIDDGFIDGAELTSSGFATSSNNGLSYIRGVADSTLVVEQIAVLIDDAPAGVTLAPEAAGAAASLAVRMPQSEDLSRGFKATPGVPWWRLTMLRGPSSSERMTVGINPEWQESGWADVSVFYPRDYGANAAESMSDAIVQAARANESFLYNNRQINLLNPGGDRAAGATPLTGTFEDTWYKLPVRIPYYIRET